MAVGGEIGYTGAQAVVPGFDAAGVAAGIKPTGDLDMSVIASPTPCTAAATFTQCKFPAAPVLYDRQVVDFNPSGIHGVVVNSGCANACTGPGRHGQRPRDGGNPREGHRQRRLDHTGHEYRASLACSCPWIAFGPGCLPPWTS